MNYPPELPKLFANLTLPAEDSHKGQNGKVLVIGGSELFHAAGRWALDTVSRLVDMVFYCSIPSNNELMQIAKGEFWNGIVIDSAQREEYLQEADVVLIGPGMTRDPETGLLTDKLLEKYPTKKWVIDAGALQTCDPQFLTPSMIITPHQKEFEMVLNNGRLPMAEEDASPEQLQKIAARLNGVTVLLKGHTDHIFSPSQFAKIEGGSPGMTKGGTGDVLAGLVAGLYANNGIWESAVMASMANKRASEELAESVGPFFNATDLATQLPKSLWQLHKKNPTHSN